MGVKELVGRQEVEGRQRLEKVNTRRTFGTYKNDETKDKEYGRKPFGKGGGNLKE